MKKDGPVKSIIPLWPPPIWFFMPLGLWALLWLGLQAGPIEEIVRSGGPETFIHRLRSVLPLWAAYMAVVIFVVKFYRQRSNGISLFGPLGFVTAYGLVGIAASLLSPDGSVALYWAAAYLSVPLVLWGIVWGKDGLDAVHRVVSLNWLIVISGVVALFTAALLYLDLGALILTPSSWFDCPLNEDWMGNSWQDLSSGLLRPTGVGRYAAIGGIIALAGLWRRQWRFLWAAILLASLILLLTSGARGSFLGFIAGAALVVLFHGGRKTVVGGVLALLVLAPIVWSTGAYQQFFDHCVFRKETPASTHVSSPSGAEPEARALQETDFLYLPIRVTVPSWGWYLEQVSPEKTLASNFLESASAGREADSMTDVFAGGRSGTHTQAIPQVFARVWVPERFSVQPVPSSQKEAGPDTYSRLGVQPGLWELKPYRQLGPRGFVIEVPAGGVVLEQTTSKEADTPQFLVRSTGRDIRRLTGRTTVWAEGVKLFKEQPILGYGFHADRLLLGTHMHNSFMHALIQTGLAGAIPFTIALLFAWFLLVKALRNRAGLPRTHQYLLIQVAGVLAFFSVRAIPESSGAFFGVDWLLLAPILVYLQVVGRAVDNVEGAT